MSPALFRNRGRPRSASTRPAVTATAARSGNTRPVRNGRGCSIWVGIFAAHAGLVRGLTLLFLIVADLGPSPAGVNLGAGLLLLPLLPLGPALVRAGDHRPVPLRSCSRNTVARCAFRARRPHRRTARPGARGLRRGPDTAPVPLRPSAQRIRRRWRRGPCRRADDGKTSFFGRDHDRLCVRNSPENGTKRTELCAVGTIRADQAARVVRGPLGWCAGRGRWPCNQPSGCDRCPAVRPSLDSGVAGFRRGAAGRSPQLERDEMGRGGDA